MTTEISLGTFLDRAAARLDAAGIEAARREARALAAAFLPGSALYDRSRSLSAEEASALEAALGRRARREPLARILGEREFWSLPFALSADTLEPRPDSETLVEAALSLLPDRAAPLRILDLGCGSACLLLSLLSECPQAQGVGVDLAPGAAAQAARNAARLSLAARARFVVGDWAAALSGPFDLVVANPPYIERATLADLDPEVAGHDPRLALDGGADGLEAYRTLIPDLPRLLAPGGVVVMEVGVGQAPAVAALLSAAGLNDAGVRRDLAGIDRAVLAVAGAVASVP